MLPAVEHFGLGFLPWFPLYNGLLTGKFTRAGGPEDSRIMRIRKHLADSAPWGTMDRYQEFCSERGITMLEATFGWMLAPPGAHQRDRRSDPARADRPERRGRHVVDSPTADDLAQISALFDPAALQA